MGKKLFLSMNFCRRRRKSKIFLFIFSLFIISSSISYWWIEIDSTEQFLYNQIEQSQFDDDPILSKYFTDPYQINIWNIINQSKRNYFNSQHDKYLVYSCRFMCGGWGDRTRKIVASFLLSLVLNRTFLIDMTWPCSIEQILTSNYIPWSISSHPNIRNHSSMINITSLSVKDYSLLKSYDEKYSVINIQTTNIAYFDLIAHHREYSQILFDQFGLKREHIHIITVYPLFYQLLIRLKSNLEEKLNELHLNESRLLCGHLRIGRNPSNPKDVVFPHRERMNTTVLNFLRSREGRVFITTDSADVQQLARRLFSHQPSRLIEINGTIAHIDRDWNYLGCRSLEKTILDFHALSYCHLAVISKSSFGHLAILRRLDPYEQLYLYCDGIKSISNSDDYNQFKYSTC